MKHTIRLLLTAVTLLLFIHLAEATCGDTQIKTGEDYPSGTACVNEGWTKRVFWRVLWAGPYEDDHYVIDSGRSNWGTWGCTACWPGFETPFFEESGTSATWVQVTRAGVIVNNSCATANPGWRHQWTHNCGTSGASCDTGDIMPTCDPPDAADLSQCCCVNSYGACTSSPVLVDVAGNGFALTELGNGVEFDLNVDGLRESVSWTKAGSDDAWLVLDRNDNGLIDDGTELFGNYTPQSTSDVGKNGFLALADFDKRGYGGNRDGLITESDGVFSMLRLWQDINHNGISESAELHKLSEMNIESFDLDYAVSRRTDEYGNRFRYRAKVKDKPGSQIGRWAWDVFLISAAH